MLILGITTSLSSCELLDLIKQKLGIDSAHVLPANLAGWPTNPDPDATNAFHVLSGELDANISGQANSDIYVSYTNNDTSPIYLNLNPGVTYDFYPLASTILDQPVAINSNQTTTNTDWYGPTNGYSDLINRNPENFLVVGVISPPNVIQVTYNDSDSSNYIVGKNMQIIAPPQVSGSYTLTLRALRRPDKALERVPTNLLAKQIFNPTVPDTNAITDVTLPPIVITFGK